MSGAPTSNSDAASDPPAIDDSSTPTQAATVSAADESIPEPGDADSGTRSSFQSSKSLPAVENRVNNINLNETRRTLGRKDV